MPGFKGKRKRGLTLTLYKKPFRHFSHEIPQKCLRLPPLGAFFLKCAPLTGNPGSAPAVPITTNQKL